MTTIPHTAPSTRPIQRRRKPTPDTILAVWRQECHDSGRRGAYRRAAERLDVSPDTVERTVHRDEARRRAQAEQETAGLAFVPPDPTYEATRDAANQAAAAELAARLAAALTANQDQSERHTYVEPEHESGDVVAVAPLEVAAERRTDEFDGAAKTPRPVPQPEPLPHPEPVPMPDPFPTPTPDPIPVPPMPGPNPVQASPIVIRQIVRVPVEARRGGVVSWCVEHEAAAKQLAAVALFLVLVALTWIG